METMMMIKGRTFYHAGNRAGVMHTDGMAYHLYRFVADQAVVVCQNCEGAVETMSGIVNTAMAKGLIADANGSIDTFNKW